tara:strand:+ start:535 stop:795 length:261 start_codon:yes stop_codon:yes gene_type:complete
MEDLSPNKKLSPLPQPLNYFTVNDILSETHSNLSGYWSSMGFNDDNTEAYITYEMEDGGPEEVATVKATGSVICSERLMADMEAIG